jgi:hypothetical protein
MAELIAPSSESDSDEEIDTLMFYLASKRQESVWEREYMRNRNTENSL